jgi:hypothetical protein
MKLNIKILFAAILGLSSLVLVDLDHLLSRAYFHWPPFVIFFLFFGVGLLIFSRKLK